MTSRSSAAGSAPPGCSPGSCGWCRPADVTAIVNVGDDIELHGLHISPDLDTITYTLAGAIDPERGWGLAGETWQAMDALGRYGGDTWFRLGDRDLGTHLYRTAPAGRGRAAVGGDRRDRPRLGPRPAPSSRSPTIGCARW